VADESPERKVAEVMAESCELRALLKNEATDMLDTKGSALGRIRNEATAGVPPAFRPAFWLSSNATSGQSATAIPTNGPTNVLNGRLGADG